jgi:hypothetical protein
MEHIARTARSRSRVYYGLLSIPVPISWFKNVEILRWKSKYIIQI